VKGSKRQRPSGAWELRAYAGKERVVTRTFKGGSRQADKALREFIGEVEGGKAGGSETQVRALMVKWLEQLERIGHSPTTLREYRRIVAKTIDPVLGHVQLRKLSALDLDSLYLALGSRGLSPASIRQVHAVLRASLRQGVKWGWLEKNPAENATPPRAVKKEVEAPTFDEVQKLISYAQEDDPELAILIALAATIGARRGEICALRWSDIDWEGHSIRICRSVATMGRGNLVIKDTKTHATRYVSVSAGAIALLRRHQERVAELADDLGIEIGPDSPLISYDLIRPIGPDTASHYVKAAARAVGVETHLHSLRHFAASQGIAGGHDAVTVGRRLGHANPSTTLNIYSHVVEARDRELAAMSDLVLQPKQIAQNPQQKAYN
jgi:integrase